MSTIVQRIADELRESLLRRDAERTGILRLLKSAFKNEAIEKRIPDTELPDDVAIAVLRREAKKRKDAITAYKQGAREDLATKEASELKAIEEYVPAELSSEQIQQILEEVVAEHSLMPPFNFGALMGLVMKKVAGQADGGG